MTSEAHPAQEIWVLVECDANTAEVLAYESYAGAVREFAHRQLAALEADRNEDPESWEHLDVLSDDLATQLYVIQDWEEAERLAQRLHDNLWPHSPTPEIRKLPVRAGP